MANRLGPDESLAPNEGRTSDNGSAYFVFQGDGNLVLYVARPVDGDRVARWASGTAGSAAVNCVMQGDGNLVLYDGAGNPVWSSNTWDHAGASLVVQDDENVVIYGPGGDALWTSDTWIGAWSDDRFDIASSGLAFPNLFPDAKLHGIQLNGLCGGMTFTALDYHYAGRPASRLNNPPSTENNPLGVYIKARHVQTLGDEGAAIANIIFAVMGIPLELIAASVASGVPTYNLNQFLLMAPANDTALRERSLAAEFPKIRQALDAGNPVPVGLIGKEGLLSGHQLAAVAYRDGKHDKWLKVFDQNYPRDFQILWISPDHDIQQEPSNKFWRGLFLESYLPQPPPRVGIDEGLAIDGKVFDADFYLGLYDDLSAAFGGNHDAAINHWLTFGTREMRRACRVFDSGYYLSPYPDLTNAFGANDAELAIQHWLWNGITEGRRSALEFDVGWYLANHGDLVNAFGAGNHAAALDHWFNFGLAEGRRSSADFDVSFYLGSYGDLQAAFGAANYPAAFDHWIKYGKREGRKGAP